jgi:hypothetical protein
MSDDLASGRMIRRLDSRDLGYKTRVFLVNERDELVFRRSRSDDEDRVNAIESSRDIVKETPRIVGVLARFTAAFRMAVNMVLR